MPMPLRQQNAPMHPGFGPRRMTPMPQRYYGGMPYAGFNHPQQMGRPMMTRNNGNRNGGGGGGLLAKILGRGKEQNGLSGMMSSMPRSAPSASGGILKTLTNPDALNGFLNNTQTVLKTAQQLGPVIQQYGPLVRNLPSLWKLYKGLKDASSETETDSETEPAADTNDINMIEDDELVEINPIINENSSDRTTKKRAEHVSLEEENFTSIKNKRSVPKLYI